MQESLAEYSRQASEQADIEAAVMASTTAKGRRQKMVYVAKKKA